MRRLISKLVLGQMSGSELLQRSIDYHDPDGRWDTFDGKFQLIVKRPDRDDGTREVSINLKKIGLL